MVARPDLGTHDGAVDVPLTDGLSGTAPSDYRKVTIIDIAADLESQQEIVSEVPEGSILFSSDGRLSHLPSLARSAA